MSNEFVRTARKPSSPIDPEYYRDKIEILKDVFGTDEVSLEPQGLRVGRRIYTIVDDVIVLLDDDQIPAGVKRRLLLKDEHAARDRPEFAEDIQFTFGEEWKSFPKILPEHEKEFHQYFDVVDLDELKGQRVCDLGCGIARWSHFLKDDVKELMLVDFSEAIFVARSNLRTCNHAIFFMGDLKRLPFRDDFADFIYCIGVLMTLPADALEETRALARYAPKLLIYLYWALDNRPLHFRLLLKAVTVLRESVCRIRNPRFRMAFTWFGLIFLYRPLILLGRSLNAFGLSHHVPLYDFYQDKAQERIRQDVYDRFFTRIEQRVSRKQIMRLEDTFSRVVISEGLPYWHFLCQR